VQAPDLTKFALHQVNQNAIFDSLQMMLSRVLISAPFLQS
jgi:hypothetical protein